jgi:hypothetical protein
VNWRSANGRGSITIEPILMERLGVFADSDGLSQLLLRLTVNSTLYCLSAMTAPWGFKVAPPRWAGIPPPDLGLGVARG